MTDKRKDDVAGACKRLERHNKWRRGEEGYDEMCNPTQLGKDIETLIRAASTPSAEVQLKNERFMRKEYFLETVSLTNEAKALRDEIDGLLNVLKIIQHEGQNPSAWLAEEALNQTSKVINKVGE